VWATRRLLSPSFPWRTTGCVRPSTFEEWLFGGVPATFRDYASRRHPPQAAAAGDYAVYVCWREILPFIARREITVQAAFRHASSVFTALGSGNPGPCALVARGPA